MQGPPGDRIRALLAAGWELLQAGRNLESADAFGRILLQDPTHAEARRGLAKARTATAEERRLLDARFEEARKAVEAGERERARALLEDVVRAEGDRDRALALLDRLDSRGGRLEGPPAPEETMAAPPSAPSVSHGWSRRALAAVWATVFILMATGVASSWERLVGGLVRPPSPTVPAPLSAQLPGQSSADRAIAEARRLMERGDPAGALRALEGVSPEEPAYPFARRLRDQARAELNARGGAR